MFVPLVSSPRPTRFGRRKGGGGKGLKGFKPSINIGGSAKSASPYGPGGGHATTLPTTAGPAPNFGGRSAGGGNRDDVYGSREYGSGYPGISGRGVDGRGFPYFYWPIVWLGFATSASYLYSSAEYGLPGSIYRPGGALMSTAYKSRSTGSIFRLTADNETTISLTDEIEHKCSALIADSDVAPVSNTSDASQARPEQAVQYYRASSVVLTLDGYNNSAAFGPRGEPDTPLPDGVDAALLECLNRTIGEAVPLVDADARAGGPRVWDVVVCVVGVLVGGALAAWVLYKVIDWVCQPRGSPERKDKLLSAPLL